MDSTVTSKNAYGCVIVRLSDRLLLGKVTGMPPILSCTEPSSSSSPSFPSPSSSTPKRFSIPNTVWAELISKCAAPHFRTSSFLTVLEEEEEEVEEKEEKEEEEQKWGKGEEGGTKQKNKKKTTAVFGLDRKERSLSYHVLTTDRLGFALLADQTVGRRDGHRLLDDIAALFARLFVERADRLTPAMVDVFAKPCRERLLQFSRGNDNNNNNNNNGPTDEKIRMVKSAVDEVRHLAMDNVEKAIHRGGRIEDIVRQTDDLQFQAQGFQRSSRDLSNQMWWNSMKGRVLVGGVSVAFILLVLFTFFYDGSSGSGAKPTAAPTA